MVRLAQIIGAAALLSQSVLAAPTVRRQYGDSSYQQSGNSYQQPAQPAPYGNQPAYGDAYTSSVAATSMMDDATSTPMMDDMPSSSMMMDEPTSTTMMDDATSTTMMDDATSTTMMDDATSTMMDNATSTTMMDNATSTSMMAYGTTSVMAASAPAYMPSASPMYGSGQSSWGQSYNDCVSKCASQYGAPPQQWSPSQPMPPPQGTGAVHTVMVAPTQGVLRYWPFAVNATVGDTIRYVWTTPANHTATLSSALAICNKSALADQLKWASGVRNASAAPQTFDVTIQTNDQQFFYCSVAQHCSKGMFGMVLPKMGGNNTVGLNMNNWLSANPDLKAAWSVVHEKTQGTAADTWGNNINIDDIPEASHMDLAQNIIWNRAMFAANPGTIEAGSAKTPDGSPLTFVGDLNTLLSATSQDPSSNVPKGTPTGSVPAASAVASQIAHTTTGAGFKTSVSVWMAAFIGAVSYLVL